jgi:hypothetical protein
MALIKGDNCLIEGLNEGIGMSILVREVIV